MIEESFMQAMKETLRAIWENDTNYDVRNWLVVRAYYLATLLKYPCGIGFDDKEPCYPIVLYIELPGSGQVSWHMPPHTVAYDGHATEEKYDRIEHYITHVKGEKDGDTSGT